ncbi:MAG: LytR family transcriptional regulator [Propionibacteriales bacterium]|nr:LytR family transcriptional regulator [Propionibacteriales bacterium]
MSLLSRISPRRRASHRGEPSRGLIGRHKVTTILLGLFVLVAGSCGSLALYYNIKLGEVDRIAALGDDVHRPDKADGDAARALNILLFGTDNGNGSSIKEELADGEWAVGAHRSDTIMIMHITADRKSAYLVSIPRDSYVKIPGHGMDKINAAFSYGGPHLAQQTIERLTDVRMDHVAIIDWASFKDLTTALGGVEVTVAETFTDTHNDVTWEKGTHNIEGEKALQYVRTRYGLDEGDFDRIKRQQNFLRAMLHKMLSQGTVSDPIKLTRVLEVLTDNLTVDEEFSPGIMRDLALSLRGLRGGDVVYLTAPQAGYGETEDGQSIVKIDRKESKALFAGLRDDDIESYLRRYGGDRLPDRQSVN